MIIEWCVTMLEIFGRFGGSGTYTQLLFRARPHVYVNVNISDTKCMDELSQSWNQVKQRQRSREFLHTYFNSVTDRLDTRKTHHRSDNRVCSARRPSGCIQKTLNYNDSSATTLQSIPESSLSTTTERTIMVALEMSEAFDTINHGSLLSLIE